MQIRRAISARAVGVRVGVGMLLWAWRTRVGLGVDGFKGSFNDVASRSVLAFHGFGDAGPGGL